MKKVLDELKKNSIEARSIIAEINSYLEKYGTPPQQGETWPAAMQKLLSCIKTMENKISKQLKVIEAADRLVDQNVMMNWIALKVALDELEKE
jgi:hypothetical protein